MQLWSYYQVPWSECSSLSKGQALPGKMYKAWSTVTHEDLWDFNGGEKHDNPSPGCLDNPLNSVGLASKTINPLWKTSPKVDPTGRMWKLYPQHIPSLSPSASSPSRGPSQSVTINSPCLGGSSVKLSALEWKWLSMKMSSTVMDSESNHKLLWKLSNPCWICGYVVKLTTDERKGVWKYDALIWNVCRVQQVMGSRCQIPPGKWY